MSVDQNTVRRVARLSRIKVKDEDVPRLAGELNAILHWMGGATGTTPTRSWPTHPHPKTISTWFPRWWNEAPARFMQAPPPLYPATSA